MTLMLLISYSNDKFYPYTSKLYYKIIECMKKFNYGFSLTILLLIIISVIIGGTVALTQYKAKGKFFAAVTQSTTTSNQAIIDSLVALIQSKQGSILEGANGVYDADLDLNSDAAITIQDVILMRDLPLSIGATAPYTLLASSIQNKIIHAVNSRIGVTAGNPRYISQLDLNKDKGINIQDVVLMTNAIGPIWPLPVITFRTEKSQYNLGETVAFRATVIEADGTSLTPDEGANMYVSRSSSVTDLAYLDAMKFNASKGYYEYLPYDNGAAGDWLAYSFVWVPKTNISKVSYKISYKIVAPAPVSMSNPYANQALVNNGTSAATKSLVSFTYTLNNSSMSPVYISKNPALAIKTVVSGVASTTGPATVTVSGDGVGDTSSSYVIKANTSRTFTYQVLVSNTGNPSSNVITSLTAIYYGSSDSNLQATSITTGLEPLKVSGQVF